MIVHIGRSSLTSAQVTQQGAQAYGVKHQNNWVFVFPCQLDMVIDALLHFGKNVILSEVVPWSFNTQNFQLKLSAEKNHISSHNSLLEQPGSHIYVFNVLVSKQLRIKYYNLEDKDIVEDSILN